jgi:hypothetical protein
VLQSIRLHCFGVSVTTLPHCIYKYIVDISLLIHANICCWFYSFTASTFPSVTGNEAHLNPFALILIFNLRLRSSKVTMK